MVPLSTALPPLESAISGRLTVTVSLLLLVIASILLVLAAFGVGEPRLSLGWLGLALWLLAVGILPALS